MSSLDVLCTFYIFFGTNLLIQCQVPVPVFSVFLTLFRSDFGTESKRNKIPEMIFSRTEEDQGACGPSQEGYREPTSPPTATRGRRWVGLWPPWRPPDLDPSPIYFPVAIITRDSFVGTDRKAASFSRFSFCFPLPSSKRHDLLYLEEPPPNGSRALSVRLAAAVSFLLQPV